MARGDLLGALETCTLPSVELPLRVAEFDDLFAAALEAQERVTATRLVWVLSAAAEARARDLARRETACCSFFMFTFSRHPGGAGEEVRVSVEVPAEHAAVLDALAVRAQSVAGAGK